MNDSSPPLVSEIVLIGGGHAHAHLLLMYGMEPMKSLLTSSGIHVTLIARDILTPYSGMLPGFVSGHYGYDEIHIDLVRLCSFSSIRLIHSAAVKIEYNDGGGGAVYLEDGRPPVRFDALSVDVGSNPRIPKEMNAAEEKDEVVTPVKPISNFASRWEGICGRLSENAGLFTPSNPFLLVVVGSGAGGIELALSAQLKLIEVLKEASGDPSSQSDQSVKVVVATRGGNLLASHNPKVRTIFRRILKERNIEMHFHAKVTGVRLDPEDKTNRTLLLSGLADGADDQGIRFHECLWCTSAGADSWLDKNTPFKTTSDGFIKVDDTYECVDHPGVFAAGDCCSMEKHPRPKAGVFAVRAGPILRENLVAYILNRPLERHHPQETFLSLISTGDKNCVASYGYFAFEGRHLWTLKDYIDCKFMDKHKNLPVMEDEQSQQQLPDNVLSKGQEAMSAFLSNQMRCGGCGAKVGATTVSRVLEAVHQRRHKRENKSAPPLSSIQHDDAAIVPLPTTVGGAMIHTIDFFRSFISDPFVFGKIAAVHALSDCHAMGAKAQTALALAVVPYSATESITESTLISMLSGASDVLSEDSCELVGGHTCEGSELALGFAVNGYVPDQKILLHKWGGRPGDHLVITKPVGTGALFAADMRAKCNATHVEAALKSMQMSNGPASQIAMEMNQEYFPKKVIRSCTDVTGFGLAGHLLEMLMANHEHESEGDEITPSIGAILRINSIPFFEGALEASTHDIFSSLQRENARTRKAVSNHALASTQFPIKYPLIFDPQTAGGLLFFVDPAVSDEFVKRLNQHRPNDGEETPCSNTAAPATVIGEIVEYNTTTLCSEGVCTIGGGKTLSGTRLEIMP